MISLLYNYSWLFLLFFLLYHSRLLYHVLYHYYITIILIIFLLIPIISRFCIPIFRSWWTLILVLCTEGWLISVQDGPGAAAKLWDDEASSLCETKSTYSCEQWLLYALFLVLYLLFWMYVHDLAACNLDLRTAGWHTLILWDV